MRRSPPDRRSTMKIGAGACPVGASCYCCPLAVEKWHSQLSSQRTCREPHPPAEKLCSPPYPKNIPPCPERLTLPTDPPAGSRPVRFEVCIECGRITARRWTDPAGQALSWCAGQFPPQ